MVNKIANSQNNVFSRVLEDLKISCSILFGIALEESQNKQNLEYFEQTATSKEDSKVVQELKESLENLDKKAENYINSIGMKSTKPKKAKTTNVENKTYTLNKSQNTTNKNINEKQSTIEHNDDYDMEI